MYLRTGTAGVLYLRLGTGGVLCPRTGTGCTSHLRIRTVSRPPRLGNWTVVLCV